MKKSTPKIIICSCPWCPKRECGRRKIKHSPEASNVGNGVLLIPCLTSMQFLRAVPLFLEITMALINTGFLPAINSGHNLGVEAKTLRVSQARLSLETR